MDRYFPMDGLPDDEDEVRSIYRKVLAARKRLRFVKSKTGTGANKVKALIKPVLKPFARAIWGRKRTVRYIERIAKKYPLKVQQCCRNSFRLWTTGKLSERRICERCAYGFEDCKAMAPGCYDYYLTSLLAIIWNCRLRIRDRCIS